MSTQGHLGGAAPTLLSLSASKCKANVRSLKWASELDLRYHFERAPVSERLFVSAHIKGERFTYSCAHCAYFVRCFKTKDSLWTSEENGEHQCSLPAASGADDADVKKGEKQTKRQKTKFHTRTLGLAAFRFLSLSPDHLTASPKTALAFIATHWAELALSTTKGKLRKVVWDLKRTLFPAAALPDYLSRLAADSPGTTFHHAVDDVDGRWLGTVVAVGEARRLWDQQCFQRAASGDFRFVKESVGGGICGSIAGTLVGRKVCPLVVGFFPARDKLLAWRLTVEHAVANFAGFDQALLRTDGSKPVGDMIGERWPRIAIGLDATSLSNGICRLVGGAHCRKEIGELAKSKCLKTFAKRFGSLWQCNPAAAWIICPVMAQLWKTHEHSIPFTTLASLTIASSSSSSSLSSSSLSSSSSSSLSTTTTATTTETSLDSQSTTSSATFPTELLNDDVTSTSQNLDQQSKSPLPSSPSSSVQQSASTPSCETASDNETASNLTHPSLSQNSVVCSACGGADHRRRTSKRCPKNAKYLQSSAQQSGAATQLDLSAYDLSDVFRSSGVPTRRDLETLYAAVEGAAPSALLSTQALWELLAPRLFRDVVASATTSDCDLNPFLAQIEQCGSEQPLFSERLPLWSALQYAAYRRTTFTDPSSNSAETWNALMMQTRTLPLPLMVVESLRSVRFQLMKLRHELDANAVYAPFLLEKDFLRNQARSLKALAYTVDAASSLYAGGVLQQVQVFKGASSLPSPRRRTVNLAERTCSCGYWQTTGEPCSHVICLALHQHASVAGYLHPPLSAAHLRAELQRLRLVDLPNPLKWREVVTKSSAKRPRAAQPPTADDSAAPPAKRHDS